MFSLTKPIMKRTILSLVFIITISFSCTLNQAESLKAYVEYKTQSDDFVRWEKGQPITWDLFNGEPEGESVYHYYFGMYFMYNDMDSDLKFNVTVYFDKNQSWVKPKEQWGQYADNYEQAQKLLKLRFDFYEAAARKFRKHLIENKSNFTDETALRALGKEYYDAAAQEFNMIEEELKGNYSDAVLFVVRMAVDEKLAELEAYDTRVNTTIID
jgi:hypothetical protein